MIGLFRIPLDIMTITIAAITIGIAVDNTIHYLYRYRENFKKTMNISAAILLSHNNVGYAVLTTSLAIAFGFSVLTLSNFIHYFSKFLINFIIFNSKLFFFL